jgi:hypothetical protein
MPNAKLTTDKMVKSKSAASKKAVKPAMDKKDGSKMTPKEKFLEMIKAKKKKK